MLPRVSGTPVPPVPPEAPEAPEVSTRLLFARGFLGFLFFTFSRRTHSLPSFLHNEQEVPSWSHDLCCRQRTQDIGDVQFKVYGVGKVSGNIKYIMYRKRLNLASVRSLYPSEISENSDYLCTLLYILYPLHHLARSHRRALETIGREHHCRFFMASTPPRSQLFHQTIWYLRPAGRAGRTGKYPVGNACFAEHMTPKPVG